MIITGYLILLFSNIYLAKIVTKTTCTHNPHSKTITRKNENSHSHSSSPSIESIKNENIPNKDSNIHTIKNSNNPKIRIKTVFSTTCLCATPTLSKDSNKTDLIQPTEEASNPLYLSIIKRIKQIKILKSKSSIITLTDISTIITNSPSSSPSSNLIIPTTNLISKTKEEEIIVNPTITTPMETFIQSSNLLTMSTLESISTFSSLESLSSSSVIKVKTISTLTHETLERSREIHTLLSLKVPFQFSNPSPSTLFSSSSISTTIISDSITTIDSTMIESIPTMITTIDSTISNISSSSESSILISVSQDGNNRFPFESFNSSSLSSLVPITVTTQIASTITEITTINNTIPNDTITIFSTETILPKRSSIEYKEEKSTMEDEICTMDALVDSMSPIVTGISSISPSSTSSLNLSDLRFSFSQEIKTETVCIEEGDYQSIGWQAGSSSIPTHLIDMAEEFFHTAGPWMKCHYQNNTCTNGRGNGNEKMENDKENENDGNGQGNLLPCQIECNCNSSMIMPSSQTVQTVGTLIELPLTLSNSSLSSVPSPLLAPIDQSIDGNLVGNVTATMTESTAALMPMDSTLATGCITTIITTIITMQSSPVSLSIIS